MQRLKAKQQGMENPKADPDISLKRTKIKRCVGCSLIILTLSLLLLLLVVVLLLLGDFDLNEKKSKEMIDVNVEGGVGGGGGEDTGKRNVVKFKVKQQ